MNRNKINIQTITSESLRQGKYLDVFPEYYALEKTIENGLWHHNQNVLDHMIKVFSSLENVLTFNDIELHRKEFLENYLSEVIGLISRKEILIVSTLLHDIAKPETLIKHPDGTTSCPNHETVSSEKVKLFSDRFDLNKKDEEYVRRIIKHHGYISEILNLMISNGNTESYLDTFIKGVGDVAIELTLLMKADLLGSDLKISDKRGYDERLRLLSWMLKRI